MSGIVAHPQRNLRNSLSPLLIAVLLGACASLNRDFLEDWPEDLPPANYFVSLYGQDARNQEEQSLTEYMYWVRKYYEGTMLYPRGWRDISRDMLDATADSRDKEQLAQRLALLGRDIAGEWSKDGGISLIKNHNLATWSIAAGRAVEEDNVLETLDRIDEDVKKLLSGELTADLISADRYHALDPDDPFAF